MKSLFLLQSEISKRIIKASQNKSNDQVINLARYLIVYDPDIKKYAFVCRNMDNVVLIYPGYQTTVDIPKLSSKYIPLYKRAEWELNVNALRDLVDTYNKLEKQPILNEAEIQKDIEVQLEEGFELDDILQNISEKYNISPQDLRNLFVLSGPGYSIVDEDEVLSHIQVEKNLIKGLVGLFEYNFLMDILSYGQWFISDDPTGSFLSAVGIRYKQKVEDLVKQRPVLLINSLLESSYIDHVKQALLSRYKTAVEEVSLLTHEQINPADDQKIQQYISNTVDKIIRKYKQDFNIVKILVNKFLKVNFDLAFRETESDYKQRMTARPFIRQLKDIAKLIYSELFDMQKINKSIRNKSLYDALESLIEEIENRITSEDFKRFIISHYPTYPIEKFANRFISYLKEELFKLSGQAKTFESPSLLYLFEDIVRAMSYELVNTSFPSEFLQSAPVREDIDVPKTGEFRRIIQSLYDQYSIKNISRKLDKMGLTIEELEDNPYFTSKKEELAIAVHNVIEEHYHKILTLSHFRDIYVYVTDTLAKADDHAQLIPDELYSRISAIVKEAMKKVNQYDIINLDGEEYLVLDKRAGQILLANVKELNDCGYTEISSCGENVPFTISKQANYMVRQCPVDGLIVKLANRCGSCPYELNVDDCTATLHAQLTKQPEKKAAHNVKIAQTSELNDLLERISFKQSSIITTNEPIMIYDQVVKKGTQYVGIVIDKNMDDSLVVMFKDANKSCIMWESELEKVSSKKDLLPGGLADNLDDIEFDKKQLNKGIEVEMEHTNNPEIAKEIAKDHLVECEDYYDRLEKMEQECKSK